MNGRVKLWQVESFFHFFDHFNVIFETSACFLELEESVIY